MTNISIKDNYVRFHKKLWADNEIIIAKCFNFDVDIESGFIFADIYKTYKYSMYEFIKVCFKNFSESIDEKPHRESIFEQMEAVYLTADNHVTEEINKKLPYASKLYAHQLEGLRFGFYNRCSFIAYQMRLGKSIIAASFSRLFSVKRTLIICPAVAKIGWYRDMVKVWGYNELYFSVLDASKYKTFTALQERFIIINYDCLDKHMKYILSDKIGHVILDEAHRCKNKNSARFKYVEKIISTFPDTKITFLSGTPGVNRFNDFFAYFKLAGHHLGDSYKKFLQEFTIQSNMNGNEKVTGAKNIKDLKLKMSNFMLVKTMDECFDMPEDVISRYTFQMDDYRPEYDKIISELSQAKELAALNGHMHSLNIITCKSKIPGIIEALEEIIAEQGKVVVFGTYKEPLQMLQDYFKERCLKIVGGVSSIDRDKYKQMFTSDPNIQVMLGNYEACGEALDLSVASDVFIINFPFTPKELNQALFRVKHPEKRTKHTRVHFTFCEDSIDEHIYDNIIVDKSRDFNALLHNDKEVVVRENVTEILIKSILGKKDVQFMHGKGHKENIVHEVMEVTEEEYDAIENYETHEVVEARNKYLMEITEEDKELLPTEEDFKENTEVVSDIDNQFSLHLPDFE